jgi:phage terminase Nu1 subunit (DNA packaging protein)
MPKLTPGKTLEQALTPENIERALKESCQDQIDFLKSK